MRPAGRGRSVMTLVILASLCTATVLAEVPFVRGDVDGRAGLNVRDALVILELLFRGGDDAVSCQDAADFDDSGQVDVSDAIALLGFVFGSSPGPAAPHEFCGVDPTDDTTTCAAYARCDVDVFGIGIEGKSLVFVVDAIGSLTNSGELIVAKRMVSRVLVNLPSDFEFGVLFFRDTVTQFPESDRPVRATRENVNAALNWINSVPSGSQSCVQEGLFAAYDMARRSATGDPTVIYIGKGNASCHGTEANELRNTTLALIRNRNTPREVIIHAVETFNADPDGKEFMRRLARENGGQFRDRNNNVRRRR